MRTDGLVFVKLLSATHGTYINILIFDYKGATVTDVFVNYNNGTSKTINGTKGFMYSDNVGYTFSYAKGNKVISIQSDNENLIGPVIAK